MKKPVPAGGLLKGLPKRLGLDSTIRTAKQIADDVAETAAKASRISRKALKTQDAKSSKLPVHSGRVGSYRKLKKRKIPDDRMGHGHIPSSAALKKRADQIAAEKPGRPLTRKEKAELHRQARAIEVHEDLHRDVSRTYRGSNTPSQIARDAGNLHTAIERDIEAYATFFKSEGWSDTQIHEAFNPIRQASHEFLDGEWWNPLDANPEPGHIVP